MAFLKIAGIQSYKELDEWMGDRQTRVVGYHTVARRGDDLVDLQLDHTRTIVIRQWNTDIYTLTEKNIATLDVGDWFTVTTKQRLNDLLPPGLNIYSDKGRWYICDVHGTGYPTNAVRDGIPFYNGIQINVATLLMPVAIDEVRQEKEKARRQDRENDALKKKIAAYLKGLTDQKLRDVLADAEHNGTSGDCWFCSMFEQSGLPQDNEHLISHLDEKYYMVSLFLNALKNRGSPGACLYSPEIVRHDVGRYLRKRLLKGIAVA
jgi:hypothetical protein